MEVSNEENNYIDLLNHLRCVVEGLLGCNPNNIWDVYGGFQRLHVAMVQILKHGFRFFKDNGEPDLWIFIQGLGWLQPTLAASPSFLGHPSSPIRSPLRHNDKALTWLYKSIESHTLSEKLSWLLSDHEHLLSCYKVNAYIRQVQYSDATLICLRSVEQRQVSLLAKIDLSLYLKKKIIPSSKHRRCSSYPEPNFFDDAVSKSRQGNTKESSSSSNRNAVDATDSPTPEKIIKVARSNTRVINSIFKNSEEEKMKKNFIKNCHLKSSFSTADLYLLYQKESQRFSYLKMDKPFKRRRSFSNSSYSHSEDYLSGGDDKHWLSDVIEVKYDKPNDIVNNKRVSSSLSQKTDSVDSLLSISSADTILSRGKVPRHRKRRRSSSFFTLPFRIWEASDDEKSVGSDDSKTLVPINVVEKNKKKSFIENGGNIILPMSIGSFPKPSPGQSIMSFLMSGVFTQTNAELDRENAHFHISEALIAALEQVKCNQQLKITDDILEESDEEINNLKRIIRIRRLQKEKERNLKGSSEFFSTDTTITTDQSVNSLTSSVYSTSESISTDQEENHENRNLLSTARSGLSVSKLSLASNDDDGFDRGCSNANTTAESVAISLISRFKENQLPAASEIEWLVSEQDAPQRILPLPNTVFDNEEANRDSTEVNGLLRGTSEWAPPRPQIIFTPHPPPIRRQIMEKQAYRCAGCGMKVAPRYASKFRYCEYLGRYFCTGCHNEQTAIIPGRVLMKWDLTRYPVSNFSYRLLDQLAEDPLFNIMDLNSALFHRARGLQKVRSLRFTLFYLKDFIFTCKYTEKLQKLIKSQPNYIYTDPDCYSLADFIRVKNNKLYKSLSDIVKHCERHTAQCQLCQARGFMCEICTKPDVIFPWQLSTVLRCDKCGSCHHMKCFKRKPVCPKCARITNRNNLHQICGQRGILSS